MVGIVELILQIALISEASLLVLILAEPLLDLLEHLHIETL